MFECGAMFGRVQRQVWIWLCIYMSDCVMSYALCGEGGNGVDLDDEMDCSGTAFGSGCSVWWMWL